ncbi:hypothetical protein D3C75_1050960 [compost metagenome]
MATTNYFAFEDPNLHTDHTVSGVSFVGVVVDIGTQGVQRHTTFAIPLGTSNLSTAETTAHLDLDALGTNTHGVLYGALHGATEHYAAFQLLSYALRNQHSVEFRLADLFDVDVHRHTHLLGQVLTQLLDIFTFLTDNDTGTSGVDGDACSLSRTMNIDTAYGRAF